VSSTEVESLSCQELVELVTDYLEGALTPEERRRFEGHLAECANCVIYLDQMRQTIRLTGTLRSDDLDPHAEETLLAAFRTWKSS
jgi:anti-sigma factor RsiW